MEDGDPAELVVSIPHGILWVRLCDDAAADRNIWEDAWFLVFLWRPVWP